MKKLIIATLTIIAATASASFAGIHTTPHNLTTRNSNTSEACVFCHTPHRASTVIKPLWNRNLPTASAFKLYSSETTKMKIYKSGLTATSMSLTCMSCHDGGSLGGRIINNPTDVPDGTAVTADALPTASASYHLNFGTDLSNHHPINFNLDDFANPKIAPQVAIEASGLPLFKTGRPIEGMMDNGRGIECSTCHNSHDNSNGKFLRNNNFCVVCHLN